jgi:hypothetical protein
MEMPGLEYEAQSNVSMKLKNGQREKETWSGLTSLTLFTILNTDEI